MILVWLVSGFVIGAIFTLVFCWLVCPEERHKP